MGFPWFFGDHFADWVYKYGFPNLGANGFPRVPRSRS